MTPHHEPARYTPGRPDDRGANRENGFAASGGSRSTRHPSFDRSGRPAQLETDRMLRSALMDCYNG